MTEAVIIPLLRARCHYRLQMYRLRNTLRNTNPTKLTSLYSEANLNLEI